MEVRYEEFPKELRGGILGFTTAKFNDCYIIAIDSTRHPLTQRHTLGHELAHIYLDHLEQPGRNVREQEREANRAAWYFYRQYKAGNL